MFKQILKAFEQAQQCIVDQHGTMTTLCVGVVVPLHEKKRYGLCVVNVGDSYAYVFNKHYGVKEVTEGSHPVDELRDMRHSGGALGPADGYNPDLSNLTCSFVILEEGDLVFLCSDGISDNFDPVVSKKPSVFNEDIMSLSSSAESVDAVDVADNTTAKPKKKKGTLREQAEESSFEDLTPNILTVTPTSVIEKCCTACRNSVSKTEKDEMIVNSSSLNEHNKVKEKHKEEVKTFYDEPLRFVEDGTAKRNSPTSTNHENSDDIVAAKNKRNSPVVFVEPGPETGWNEDKEIGRNIDRRPSSIKDHFPSLNEIKKSPSKNNHKFQQTQKPIHESISLPNHDKDNKPVVNPICVKCGNRFTRLKSTAEWSLFYEDDNRSTLLDFSDGGETTVRTKRISESASMDNIKKNGHLKVSEEENRTKSNSFTEGKNLLSPAASSASFDATVAKLNNASSIGHLSSQASLEDLSGKKVISNDNLTPRERRDAALQEMNDVRISFFFFFPFFVCSYS